MSILQAEFNPTILFNLLVGSAGSAGKRNPGPILTSLRENLRKEIEGALPIIYLYDAEIIVESMFYMLNPHATSTNITLDLSRYISSVSNDEGLSSFYSYEKSKNKKEVVIKQDADPDVLNIYIDAYNKAIAEKPLIIKAVLEAILKVVPNKTQVKHVVSSIAEKQAQLQAILLEVTAIGVPPDSKQLVRFTKLIRAAGRAIRTATSGIRQITDAEELITDYNNSKQLLIVAHNFDTAKRAANTSITKALSDLLYSRYGIKVQTTTTGFQAGNFAAAGHVGFTSGDSFGINTPQLQTASLILAKAGREAPGLVDKFINNTDHSKWLINIDKNYGTDMKNILSIGVSLVRSQPSYFNSGVLSTQESAIVNTEIQSILNESYNDALESMQKEMANNSDFHNYIINTFRMSPTIAENVSNAIGSILVGTKAKMGKSSRSGSASKSIGSIPGIISEALSKLSTPKATSAKPIQKLRTVGGQFYSVTSLQTLINELLPKYMEKNMGKGDSRVLLNYRSGRLAESAQVERMSVSREGMITAFYNYMRNPYGTFSIGGQQNEPPSRDPKLLISKSIREIAATKVANRMRAVLV